MKKESPGLVNMKRSPDSDCYPCPPVQSEYPYGLSLSLGQEELEKLGLDKSVKVGDQIVINAVAKVTSSSRFENEGSEPNCRIEMILTDMSAEPGEAEEEEKTKVQPRHKRLYT